MTSVIVNSSINDIFCGIKPIRCLETCVCISLKTLIEPSLIVTAFTIADKSVVFPQPDGPIKAYLQI